MSLLVVMLCVLLAVVILSFAGLALLARFLLGDGSEIDADADRTPPRGHGLMFWRHLQVWFKAQPKSLGHRK